MEAREDAHRRALARAVGSEETDDLAAFDLEGQVFDGRVVGVALGEVFDLDHRLDGETTGQQEGAGR